MRSCANFKIVISFNSNKYFFTNKAYIPIKYEVEISYQF